MLRLVNARYLEFTSPSGLIYEANSISFKHLQISDLAVGFAKDWYLAHGIRKIRDNFKSVVFNGKFLQ